ncbi:hypothetical protein LguiB_017038 [Lonicera macranthoides]
MLEASISSTPKEKLRYHRTQRNCPPLKSNNQRIKSGGNGNLSFGPSHVEKVQFRTNKRLLMVQAGYGDRRRPSSGIIFVGGFILGGMVVGTLGCVYAPQISSVLAGTDKKEIMKKLPKFIYDEDKALERKRKILEEKIANLNAAIDDASAHFRSGDGPNGVAVSSDEIESAI